MYRHLHFRSMRDYYNNALGTIIKRIWQIFEWLLKYTKLSHKFNGKNICNLAIVNRDITG